MICMAPKLRSRLAFVRVIRNASSCVVYSTSMNVFCNCRDLAVGTFRTFESNLYQMWEKIRYTVITYGSWKAGNFISPTRKILCLFPIFVSFVDNLFSPLFVYNFTFSEGFNLFRVVLACEDRTAHFRTARQRIRIFYFIGFRTWEK